MTPDANAARSTTMRKLMIGLLAVGPALAGMLLGLVMPRHCPVTRVACKRIKPRMTQEKVYRILGGPPGDYRTRPVAIPEVSSRFWWGPPRLLEEWKGDEGTVLVDYYPRTAPGPETVMRTHFEEATPYNPTLVAIVTWRLERLKERWLP
jgi:hypothetical protein